LKYAVLVPWLEERVVARVGVRSARRAMWSGFIVVASLGLIVYLEDSYTLGWCLF